MAKYFKAAGPMFNYVLRIEDLVERFPNTIIWRLYDEEFRWAKPTRPWYLWHEINQGVLDSVCEEHRAWLKHNRQNQSQGQNQSNDQSQPKSKQRKFDMPTNGSCHKWNTHGCTRQNCQYKHVCANLQSRGPQVCPVPQTKTE